MGVRVRTLTMVGGNFLVEDDPEGVIAHLLAYATTDNELDATAFEPSGEGYYIDGIISAYRVESDDDVPAGYQGEIPTDGEVWVIEEHVCGVGSEVAWTRGDELRALLTEARRLREVER